MKEHYQKAFTKLTLFFLSNLDHVNVQDNKKQKGSGPSDQSLFIFTKQVQKIPLSVMYYLTKFDHVI